MALTFLARSLKKVAPKQHVGAAKGEETTRVAESRRCDRWRWRFQQSDAMTRRLDPVRPDQIGLGGAPDDRACLCTNLKRPRLALRPMSEREIGNQPVYERGPFIVGRDL